MQTQLATTSRANDIVGLTSPESAASLRMPSVARKALEVVPRDFDSLNIVARSGKMSRLVELALRVARVDSTVLVTGASGAGKERIARLVHQESPRSSGPFVAVNCAAISETLLESELFGHSRGAFTGATHDRAGLFEAANGGTLFLDEVGEISLGMQVKLLRVLQEREIRRVGENTSRRVDVRIVAATNCDLVGAVAKKRFRQDLFYRLKVVELRMPTLHERPEDIMPLAGILLGESARRMKRSISTIAPEAAERLSQYAWPGNVRELQNAMERAAALARGSRVELEDLPEEILRPAPTTSLASTRIVGGVRPLEDVEKDYILAALELNGGHQVHTAEQLQIGSTTLYRKLKSYGVSSRRRPADAGAFVHEVSSRSDEVSSSDQTH